MATKAQISLYETTDPLLDALYEEMQQFAKKKPDGTLSDGKVKVINRLLKDVRIVLKDAAEFKYLDLLDTDSLPQNSDVVLMLSQYKAAMDKFRSNNYGWDDKQKLRWFPSD
jgi:hypothetical protein